MDEHAARVVNFFAESARLKKPQGAWRPLRFEEMLVANQIQPRDGVILHSAFAARQTFQVLKTWKV
jgi:hypothetical protein